MFCREQRSCQTKHARALHLCQKHQSPLRSRRVAAGFSVFALVSSLHHRCVLLCPLTHSNELCINRSMQINIPRYFQCHESWVIAEFHHLSCRWQRKCLKMFGAQKAEGRENISWQRGTGLLSQELLSWAGLIVHSMGDQHHGDGMLSSLFILWALILLMWNSGEVYAPALRKEGDPQWNTEQLFKSQGTSSFSAMKQFNAIQVQNNVLTVTKPYHLPWLSTVWLKVYFTFLFLQKVHLLDGMVKSMQKKETHHRTTTFSVLSEMCHCCGRTQTLNDIAACVCLDDGIKWKDFLVSFGDSKMYTWRIYLLSHKTWGLGNTRLGIDAFFVLYLQTALVAHSLALDHAQCCWPISHTVDTAFSQIDTIIFELCIFKEHLPI